MLCSIPIYVLTEKGKYCFLRKNHLYMLVVWHNYGLWIVIIFQNRDVVFYDSHNRSPPQIPI